MAMCLAIGTSWLNPSAIADTGVWDNLNRSRDALLAQRTRLQDAANKLGQQIDYLNQQMDKVNAYLRDNDVAIRDVERALNGSH
jgi:prefoldin subunit 5